MGVATAPTDTGEPEAWRTTAFCGRHNRHAEIVTVDGARPSMHDALVLHGRLGCGDSFSCIGSSRNYQAIKRAVAVRKAGA